jgi:hypothetical protein
MNYAHAQLAQLTKMLRNLDRWLDKAVAQRQAESADAEALLEARLAPDMFTLRRQIQSACDGVKLLGARLAGTSAPKHEDTDQSLPELRARIADVIAYTESFAPADLADADTLLVTLPFLPGKASLGADFMREMSLPNTYFHLVTAYAILRHEGIALGKMDFIGSLTLRDA